MSHSRRRRSTPALYEQGKVSHVGSFPQLEDQMCAMTSGGYAGERSPDRLDAAVWALTELILEGGKTYDYAKALGQGL